MRSLQSWEQVRQDQTVERAFQEVLSRAPNTALARTGVLYNVAHAAPDGTTPTDETGEPVAPPQFFRAGMRVGSAPIKGRN